VSVGADGTVTAITPTGPQTVGQITLTQFQNPNGLLRVGNTLFAESGASGAATTGTPGSNGLGTIQQGFLEGSNVELANELVNLVIAQQTVQFNSQAIVAENAMLAATIDLIQ
jgi:flagellar basal-body rod protein FlgG